MGISGIFSIKYKNPLEPELEWSVNWSWWFPGEWSRSFKPNSSIHWRPRRGLDQFAYEAILECFGLGRWRYQFSPSEIIEMSPVELVKARREKEKEYNLERLEIMGDIVGWKIVGEGKKKKVVYLRGRVENNGNLKSKSIYVDDA